MKRIEPFRIGQAARLASWAYNSGEGFWGGG
jgi:hypothetical protein